MALKLVGAACALLLVPTAALAQEEKDLMASVYGNTITIDILGSYSARQYIDPDHTWRQVGDDGEVRGVWTADPAKTCLIQTQPPGPTRCHPYVPRQVGDTWTNIDPDSGVTVIIGLVAGRERP